MLTGIGGTMMFVGIILFFIVVAMTVLVGRRGNAPRDVPVSETLTAPSLNSWDVNLDRIGLWVGVAILLIVIAYGPFFVMYFPARFISAPFTGL